MCLEFSDLAIAFVVAICFELVSVLLCSLIADCVQVLKMFSFVVFVGSASLYILSQEIRG
jgi:hypothetical protein